MPKRMTSQEWVDGMNAQAKKTHPKQQVNIQVKPVEVEMQGVLVKVLVKCVLADPNGKVTRGWSEPGDIVAVASNKAQWLADQGYVTLDIQEPAIPKPDEPEATAAARKLAGEFSIDLHHVTATGRNKRITKADVKAAIDNRFVESLQEIADEAAQEAAENAALAALSGTVDD